MRGSRIPGTFRLEHIRAVVEAIAKGVGSSNLIGLKTGISTRHVSFAISAAEMLGWIGGTAGRWKATRSGKALLNESPGSQREAAVFEAGIASNEDLHALVPDLLGDEAPDFDEMTARISERAGLSQASAKRGARVLMSWRRQALLRADDGTSTATPPVKEKNEKTRQETSEQGTRSHPLTGEAEADIAASTSTLRLASLRIEGWGPFRAVGAELRPVTVLLGDIGSGKSTLVDAIALVGDMLNLGISRAIEARGQTFDEIVTGGRGNSFGVAFELDLPEELRPEPRLARARYELVIGRTRRRSVGVQWEWLGVKPAGGRPARVRTAVNELPSDWRPILGVGGTRRAWLRAEKARWSTQYNMSRQRLLLGAIPDDPSRFPAALAVQSFFRLGLKELDLRTSLIKKPCSPLSSPKLARDGSNLAQVIRRLRRADPERFRRWLNHLRRALPTLTDLNISQRPSDLHLSLEAHFEDKLGLHVDGRRLSDGTLRLLTLSILPYAGDAWALYVVDDPALCFGPQSVDLLTKCWADGASQILVTTQSPVWARLARLEDILCIRKNAAGTSELVAGRRHAGLKRWRQSMDRDVLLNSYL